jgi:hypothetical protein
MTSAEVEQTPLQQTPPVLHHLRAFQLSDPHDSDSGALQGEPHWVPTRPSSEKGAAKSFRVLLAG